MGAKPALRLAALGVSPEPMSEDILMKTADIVPVAAFDSEFAAWVAWAQNPEKAERQHPIDELMAEHHIMDAGLAAMERETRRLSVHHDLRPDAWRDIVDFIGNYIYQVHRRKEEDGLFEAYRTHLEANSAESGTVDLVAAEHGQATNMTVTLVNGVGEGDWEKVLRAAHLYLRVARDHLLTEENEIFEQARALLDDEAVAALKVRFTELERFGLGERDRLYYLDLVRRMCKLAGFKGLLEV